MLSTRFRPSANRISICSASANKFSTLRTISFARVLESVEEWHVCGEAENGREAVEKQSFHQPHIKVMDFNLSNVLLLDSKLHLISSNVQNGRVAVIPAGV